MPTDDDTLAREVERRIRELREDPEEFLRRFDRNGDGVLDESELRAARAAIAREVAPTIAAQATETIAGRYRIVAPIGRGSHGSTQLAVDETTGDFVAVKEIDLRSAGTWDAVEIFERETTVLGGLDHPAIPKILDSFQLDEDDNVRSFLVQEFIPGDNLQTLLTEGRLFDEAMLRRYASDVLDILVYLHGVSPPVLHRDIKPANLIERPDGSLALVDFGAAQVGAKRIAVIGTTGYMPVEQLMGRAVPRSDLYGLGATLIHLATGKHPTDMQSDGPELKWRGYAKLSTEFAGWIDSLTAPMFEDRFVSAVVARSALGSVGKGTDFHVPAIRLEPHSATLDLYMKNKPAGCRVAVMRSVDRIQIELPEPTLGFVAQALLAILMAVLLFLVGSRDGKPEFFLLAGISGAVFLAGAFLSSREFRRLEGNADGLTLHRLRGPTLRIPLSEIAGPEIQTTDGATILRLICRSGKSIRLRSLRAKEAKWAGECLREFLVERRMLDRESAPAAEWSIDGSNDRLLE